MTLTDLLVFLVSIMIGVVSTIVYALIIWRLDRYEQEPLRLLVVAFLWGAIPAVLVSALIEVAFDIPLEAMIADYADVVSISFIAPPVEEGFKALALLAIFWLARNEFDDALDGIIYGSLVGFGFAMTENILYFIGAWSEGGLDRWGQVIAARTLAFGLNHAMFTSLTGVGLGLARYSRSLSARWIFGVLGLLAAISAHLIHNFFVSFSNACLVSFLADWAGVLIVFAIVLLSWNKERSWITSQLQGEVAGGVLTPLQYETILSHRKRIQQSWNLLGFAGMHQAGQWRKLVTAAIELAFKKHQMAAMGEEKGNGATIVALRRRIVSLRQGLGDPALAGMAPCPVCGRPAPQAGATTCPHCNALLTAQSPTPPPSTGAPTAA